MEFKGATLLYTLAGLMITFAGFSALLLAIRPATGAKLSVFDKFLAKTVMSHIFILTAASLLPALLTLFDMQDKLIWRVSSVLFALPMLSFQLSYPLRRRNVVGAGPPLPILAVFVVLGAAVTASMLLYVMAGFKYSSAVYITTLTIDFFTVAFAFLNAIDVIMQQLIEQPDRPAPP